MSEYIFFIAGFFAGGLFMYLLITLAEARERRYREKQQERVETALMLRELEESIKQAVSALERLNDDGEHVPVDTSQMRVLFRPKK